MINTLSDYLPTLSLKSFIERDDLTANIRNELKVNQGVILKGCQGVGKSTIAKEFGHSMRQIHNSIVRFFDADSFDRIKDEYLKIAIELELCPSDCTDTPFIISSFYNYIKTKIKDNIYFIFDNVIDFNDIKIYTDKLPGQVKIIITTTDLNLKVNNFKDLQIKPFNREQCIKFIRKSLKKNRLALLADEESLIQSLLKEDVILPVILKTVASYLNDNEMLKIQDYVNDLKNNPEDHKEFNILFRGLNETPDAFFLLKHISYLDSSFILKDILVNIFESDHSRLERAIERLEKMYLIERCENSNGDKGISCHYSYTQDKIRAFDLNDYVLTSDVIFERLCKVLNEMPEVSEEINEDWKRSKFYGIHLNSILEKYEEEIKPYLSFDLSKKIGYYYLFVVLKYKQSIKFLKLAQDLLISTNSNDSQIGDFYIKLSTAYGKLNDLVKSLNMAEEAIKFYDEILESSKESFRSYFTALNILGMSYFKTSEVNKAIEYCEKALRGRSNLLGHSHPEMAVIYNNIGCFYEANGLYEKALEFKRKALDIRINMLNDNPKTAISYSSVAKSYSYFSEFNQMLEYYKKALDINQKIYRDQFHSDIASSHINVGFAYDNIGLFKLALFHKEEALKIRLGFLDQNHPDIAYVFNRIGLSYEYLGFYEKALSYFEDAIKINENQKLKPNNFDLSYYYMNIGRLYEKMGDLKKGLEFKLKSRDIRSEKLSNNITLSADCFNELGTIYYKLNDLDKANEYYQNAINIYFNDLYKNTSKNHPCIALVKNNIGNLLQKQNKLDEAFKYKEEALEIRRLIFKEINENHPSIAESLDSIGSFYEVKNDFSKALEYFEEALKLREKNYFKDEHIEIVESFENISRMCKKLGNQSEADKFSASSFKMKQKLSSDFIYKRYQKRNVENTESAELGRGSFGTVFLVEDIEENRVKRALKRIDVKTDRIFEGREIKVFKELKKDPHKNILKFFDYFFYDGFNYLLFEYCKEGTLDKILLKAFNSEIILSEEKKIEWYFQLISALKYLHFEKSLIHHDVKPNNILIEDNVIKLGDFGLSCGVDKSSFLYTITKEMGTLEYCSPEIVEKLNEISYKIDVWAAGCVLFEMFNFKKLFKANNEADLISKILYDPMPEINAQSNKIKNIFQKSLIRDQSKRLSSTEIYEFFD